MTAAGGSRPDREFRSADAAATEALGAAFARSFAPASGRALRVALQGELGAGKTTFVRGLLRELGVTGPVRSPTYSLVERYPTERVEVLHADLYRLTSPDELVALAFDEADQEGALWLVEWPERAGEFLPAPDLRIEFRAASGEHRLHAWAASASGQAWLVRLATENALEVGPPAP